MSNTFNEAPAGLGEKFKESVTYGELREIAQEAVDAAEKDPSGTHLALEILSGQGQLVVGMIETLARALAGVLDQLEDAQEVAA